VFIGRKGGMKNTLAPLKNLTNTNITSEPSSSLHTELNHTPKLDAIPSSQREEKSVIDDRPQSPAPGQRHPSKIEDRPQSPTPEQQEQRKTEDQQHVKDEEDKAKDLLKGKPIIFVGGGPGSGKGTQCEKMIEKYGFTHLSAGDLIRAASQDSTTEKGRYFNEAMSQGKLISTVIKFTI
jgi:hypothetical protein